MLLLPCPSIHQKMSEKGWHEFISIFANYILYIGILIYHGLCSIFADSISQNDAKFFDRAFLFSYKCIFINQEQNPCDSLGSPEFQSSRLDVFGIRFEPLIFIFLRTVATNQDLLLLFFYLYGGATNRDVLLTEMCYCSRLYGM